MRVMRGAPSRRRLVLLTVPEPLRGRVVAAVVACPGLEVVRECADVSELRAAAAAGLGHVAVLHAGMAGLGRSVVSGLREAGVVTLGLWDDEAERARLLRLGVDALVTSDAPTDRIAERLRRLTDAAFDVRPGGRARAPEAVTVAELHDGAADESGAEPQAWQEVSGEHLARLLDPRPGTVAAVWGPAGAPGRTTAAVTLAALAAAGGLSVLLVDADPYGGAVAPHVGLLDESSGLARAVARAESGLLEPGDVAGLSHSVSPNLSVLTGVPSARRWTQLRPAGLEAVLEAAREVVDLVVVDTGFCIEDDEELSYDTFAPRRNGATLAALRAADRVVVVGQGGPVARPRLVEALASLGELDLRPLAEVTVVVNRVRPSSGPEARRRLVDDVCRQAPGMVDASRVHLVGDDPAAHDTALERGMTLPGGAPDAPVTREWGLVLRALGLPGGAHDAWVGR